MVEVEEEVSGGWWCGRGGTEKGELKTAEYRVTGPDIDFMFAYGSSHVYISLLSFSLDGHCSNMSCDNSQSGR